jgi:hypothetical protein
VPHPAQDEVASNTAASTAQSPKSGPHLRTRSTTLSTLEESKDWQSESSRSSDADDNGYKTSRGLLVPRDDQTMRARLRSQLNPLRLFQTKFNYQQIPSLSADSLSALHLGSLPPDGIPWRDGTGKRRRCRFGRFSFSRSIIMVTACLFMMALLGGGGYHHQRKKLQEKESGAPYYWMNFQRLNGFYNGIRTLVPYSQWKPENGYNLTDPQTSVSPAEMIKASSYGEPAMDPIKFDPYRNHHIETCYLDEDAKTEIPDVYAYPGIPQHFPKPFYGDYETLGLDDEVCFERYGRYGPYGYGYNETLGGMGPGMSVEHAGSEKVFDQMGYINYENVDWAAAQQRCYEKNKQRFQPDGVEQKRVSRQAYILRTWTGFEYSPHHMYALRAMIAELSLKSGGEYDVHFLVHVKDNSIPIWADERVYQQVLRENVPREFWGLATLWSEKQMEMYYPEPFPNNFANMAGSSIHGVYRSAHFALQWFSQEFPDYDYYWNWEMDLRYSGHYYNFNTKISDWAKKQPRKGLWERSKRFYIPEYHGSWDNFTKFVEWETEYVDKPKNNEEQSGPLPVWGPVNNFPNEGMLDPPEGTTPPTSYEDDNYEWGVGEEADLMTFNPIFDTSQTNWVFSWDVTGYKNTLPPPPRRVAIITVSRLSKRLLDIMHHETWRMRHTMFPEMWPPSVAFHHGLKAVYIPHPVYFDRDWNLEYMNQVFNYPANTWDSPFGWGEHNMLGSGFYYNSGFSGALWRRWLGQFENGEGGRTQEEQGTGRMCLRATLHHPIKHESCPEDG